MIQNKPLLVFIGPSGVGKSTIYRQLMSELPLHFVPSWTTRPPRDGEQALEHNFVKKHKFTALQKDGYFIDVIQPFGLEYKYGLPYIVESKTHINTVSLRVFAIDMLREYYSNLLIYQVERPLEEALTALNERVEELGDRAKMFEHETRAGRKVADRIFENNNIDDCSSKIISAIKQDFQIR